ncbi:MAG: prolyl-tRNA editing protein [Candidatus Pelagibacter sp.]|nr:prolyl-tRNA editing protein [Candidatus Pelagibacter sp.]|tara:strand:- start:4851 stop:5333 length:483 start_codon:yes stop_codon:yes gene_type:complete
MNEILNKEPVERVRKKLEEFDKSLKIVLLESTARTAIDAAKSLNTEVGSIVKSLLLRTKSSYLLCLIAGDKKCSLNKLKKILKEKDLSMASANEVKEVTGFTIGGVSPIGHLKDIKVYIDNSLSRFETIYAAAGHPHCIFKISFEEIKQITSGSAMDISE